MNRAKCHRSTSSQAQTGRGKRLSSSVPRRANWRYSLSKDRGEILSDAMKDEFPLAQGVPMHLLTERALNEAFLATVEEHRRDERPLIVDREGSVAVLPADELGDEIQYARSRIAELDRRNAEFRNPFSLNETPLNHTT
jgi:hypothetical protein